jgi:spore coat protein U-like protein
MARKALLPLFSQKRFRAKHAPEFSLGLLTRGWLPVRVKKTRQIEKREHDPEKHALVLDTGDHAQSIERLVCGSNKSERVLALLISIALVTTTPRPIWATTATTTFNVQITITNACVIGSATNINFGTVGVIGATGVSATGTITATCTLLAPYNVGLNQGAGTGATIGARLMTSAAAATVTYSLYQDASHLLVWGNTIGTNTVASVGTGTAQAFTVFGLVPSQTTPAANVYNDTITVTLTF